MSERKSKFAPPSRPKVEHRSMKESFLSDPAEQTMFTLRMDSVLHKRLKMQALTEDRSMKEIVEELVAGYLNGSD